MKYEFKLPGFEQQSLFLEVRFPFRPRINVNKKVMSGTGRWNEVALRRDDGLSSIVTILNQFPDPVPALSMDEEIYHVVPRLNWLNYLWALLPLLLWIVILVFADLWSLGIALLAAYLNFWILRFQVQKLEKNLMVFVVNMGSAVVFFLLRFMMISARLGG